MQAKDAVGRYGEDIAVRHLIDAGMEVVERNWRCPAGEIDVVAREGRCLVVCEVKTRSGTAFGSPFDAITRAKAARLRRLAALWLQEHELHAEQIRFDVVGVVRPARGAAVVEHRRGVI